MANAITISRMPLLLLIILLLYQPRGGLQLLAAPLLILLIAMDGLDGMVARRRGETSLLGSVLDIAADRTVEFLLWIVYADLDRLSVVIPLVVVARGVFVDAIRAVVTRHGIKPFDMMRTSVGRFLVKSPWMRTPYALIKAVAFVLLALAHGLLTVEHPLAGSVALAARITGWLALLFCLLRGVPVLYEAPRVLKNLES